MKTGGVISWLKSHALIVICVLVGAVMVVVVQQRLSYLGDLRSKIDESQKKVDKIHANTRASATLPEDLSKVDEYNTRVTRSLFIPSEKAANLTYFYGVGAKIGVVLSKVEQSASSLASSKSSSDKNYGIVKFDVVAEGGIGNIIKFITALRCDHPLMRVERLSISPSSSRTGIGVGEVANVTFTFLTIGEVVK